MNGGDCEGECEEKGNANGNFEEEEVNDYGDYYVKLGMVSGMIARV